MNRRELLLAAAALPLAGLLPKSHGSASCEPPESILLTFYGSDEPYEFTPEEIDDYLAIFTAQELVDEPSPPTV